MKPAICVVIATRNYGQYLAEAILSVQAQTVQSWELNLIDDGSSDNTAQVVKPFLVDPRIRYFPVEAIGQGRAKNLGWRLGSAPLIAFLDADDVWLPTKLERQLDVINRDPTLGVVFARRQLMDPAGRDLPTSRTEMPTGWIFQQLLRDNWICFSSVLMQREALEVVGGFDSRLPLAIDYDLWLRVSQHYRFDYVDEQLVRYRTGHANLSRQFVQRSKITLSLLRRWLGRRKIATEPETTRYAWASTYRTIAYGRRDDLAASFRWNLQAAITDGCWFQSSRSFLGSIARWVKRRCC